MPNLTGCEMIWNQGNRGCYGHTAPVHRENNVAQHLCYIVNKIKQAFPTAEPIEDSSIQYASRTSSYSLKQYSGYCVTSHGWDRNTDITKLEGTDFGPTNDIKCLNLCRKMPNLTGCEIIWNQSNRDFYVHTAPVHRGINVA